jgi:hypothetical protein
MILLFSILENSMLECKVELDICVSSLDYFIEVHEKPNPKTMERTLAGLKA